MARLQELLKSGLAGFRKGFGEDADTEATLRLELFKSRLKKKFETETMKPSEILKELEAQEQLNEAGLGDTTKGFRGLLKGRPTTEEEIGITGRPIETEAPRPRGLLAGKRARAFEKFQRREEFKAGLKETPEEELEEFRQKQLIRAQTQTEKERLEIEKLRRDASDEQRRKKFVSQDVKDRAKDALDSIKVIKEGKDFFGLTGPIPPFPGTAKARWRAEFDKFISQKVLQVMSTLKQASRTGSTGFGQLSEKELKILQDAATSLKVSLSQEDAIELLNKMEKGLKKLAGIQKGLKTPAQIQIGRFIIERE